MRKVAFYTLGCKVNQYETQAIIDKFQEINYEIVDFADIADIYVINTCTVTGLSDRKSRQMIRRAKKNNPNSLVVVMGCYSQVFPQEILEIPEVNIILGTKDRMNIFKYIDDMNNKKIINAVSDISQNKDYEDLYVSGYRNNIRAFVKIEDGCDQFCSYCIIPYARGKVKSRNIIEIIKEVKALASFGHKEIVLTGIHLASYGKDLKDITLLDVIKRLNEIEGIDRIRLGSIEPNLINKKFVEEIATIDKLCNQFHISLQSGSNATLKRMNRKYTTDEYYEGVLLLKKYIKNVSITTDMMVGFNEESEIEFQESYEFAKKINFAKIHVFKYSPRKGTKAYLYGDRISNEIKEIRSRKLIKLSDEMQIQFNKNMIGNKLEVLFEEESKIKEGFIEGHTKNFIKVNCIGDISLIGKIKEVEIVSNDLEYVIGKIIEEN